MKNIFIMAMILICVLSFATTALALGEYKNVSELFEYWETNGYPNYVGTVYSTDGSMDNLTILIVDDNGTKADEIRSMLVDASGVTFGTAEYSHNELLKVNNEILEKYMSKDQNIYSMGLGWGWGTVDGKTTGFGESKKESRVVLTVDESVAQEYANKFHEIYGDMVVVEAGGAVVPQDEEATSPVGFNSWIILIVVCFVAIATAILFSNRRRFIPAMQTDSGTVITGDASLSRKQMIESIKNSGITPDKDCFDAIMEKIDNQIK